MRKDTKMLIRRFLQYKQNENKSNYGDNLRITNKIKENNENCITGCLSAIYT